MTKILIIGSGGRENAIIYSLLKSNKVDKIFSATSNAKISKITTPSNINSDNHQEILEFCQKHDIDLVVIGPEQPLVDGLTDFLQENHIRVFGSSKEASKLEGSKIFMKDLCKKYNISTAKYQSFGKASEAIEFLDKIDLPAVIKTDGLAAGKGVIISETKEDAKNAINEIFSGKFGSAGKKIIIEEFLEGEEVSFFAISDGKNAKFFGTAGDHKKIGDGDIGLNTGGMGAYSPAPIVDERIHEKIINEVMEPTMQGLISEGSPYLGFLYAGLMIKDGELKVLEFNCRFGDPETQPIMLRLKSSLVELCLAAINNEMDIVNVEWTEQHSCGVVIASEGYPENYATNKEVQIIDEDDQNAKLFHAGTKLVDKKILTSGGRVFCATALGSDLKQAQSKAYNLVEKVSFEGAFYRKDIGFKGIK